MAKPNTAMPRRLLSAAVVAALRMYDLWAPISDKLSPEASRKVRAENYERVFYAARIRVRAWEAKNIK